ncbi:sulfotransferase [Desulfobacula sp.]|uniref:sulfotransferase family protein n=1 Tax=Desulfobacula sp. TaxID=2593537 RepID=UPI0026199EED|nr:sulfotransferase [Desulfobacula sp.]
MAKRPDFLIVGAPKCGTTSLFRYLKNHPQIFLPEKKEPKFISSQFIKFPMNGPGDTRLDETVHEFSQYSGLFSEADDHQLCGEASADTLYYYHQSIPVIKKYIGNPKIIILLRNPVERAFSSYSHTVRDHRETAGFEFALSNEKVRIKNNFDLMWHHVKVGCYYCQVKAFLDNFEHVFVGLFDDLKKDSPSFVRNVFDFLEIDNQYLPSNLDRVYHRSYVPKYRFINQWIVRPNKLKNAAKPLFNIFFTNAQIEGMINFFKDMSEKKRNIEFDTRIRLTRSFKKDIHQLSQLIGKDLEQWIYK